MFFNNNSPTVEVKDNFLSSDEFEKLSSFLLSDDFCWFYSDCNVVENDGGMQYFHNFYNWESRITEWEKLLKSI